MSHRRKHRFKLRSLYVWHRYVGVTAAALVIVLAVTGIPLNHTERLTLDSRYVSNAWLLDWYGIEAPSDYPAFATELGAVALLDSNLYVQGNPVAGDYRKLHGAVALRDMLVVAADSDLLLFTPSGEQIERLTTVDVLPSPIERIGAVADDVLILQTAGGAFRTDLDMTRWQPWEAPPDTARWAAVTRFTEAEKQQLARQHLSGILPYERVLLDLHSGRIFGRFGPWLMDAAAVLMLFLAASGLVIWARRKR